MEVSGLAYVRFAERNSAGCPAQTAFLGCKHADDKNDRIYLVQTAVSLQRTS